MYDVIDCVDKSNSEDRRMKALGEHSGHLNSQLEKIVWARCKSDQGDATRWVCAQTKATGYVGG